MYTTSAILLYLSIYQYHICSINLCGRVKIIYAAVLSRRFCTHQKKKAILAKCMQRGMKKKVGGKGGGKWGQKSAKERWTSDLGDGKRKKVGNK